MRFHFVFSLLLASVLASQSLKDGLSGLSNVVYPSAERYANLSQSFNSRYHYKPAAVVVPKDVQEVEQAVKAAAHARVPIAPRSGGHSYVSQVCQISEEALTLLMVDCKQSWRSAIAQITLKKRLTV